MLPAFAFKPLRLRCIMSQSSNTSPSLLDQMMFSVRGDTVLVERDAGRRVPRVASVAFEDGQTKTYAVSGVADVTARVISIAVPEGAAGCAFQTLASGALDGDLVSIRATVQSGNTLMLFNTDPLDPFYTVAAEGSGARVETVDIRFIGGHWIVWHVTVIQTGAVG